MFNHSAAGVARPRFRLLFTLAIAATAAPAYAQTKPVDLGVSSLEDLMKMEISSANRKEQRAEDVPAAVFVITHDDIRRSGMTSVPDLLRLVPGVQVAQINSNKWAVSVRGFNGLYSNKLLVLIDGRSVYNPLFATAFWDTEDLMLEDVDRIEVIRGPGASVWGANAMNGVINILTKASADTTGGLVRTSAGTFDRAGLAVHYGGTFPTGAYRAFAQVSAFGDSIISPTVNAIDHWQRLTSGFRSDSTSGPEAFMVEGGFSVGQERPLWINLDPAALPQGGSAGVSDTQVGHVLGRWTHKQPSGATLQLQSFVDLAHRRESIGEYSRQTVDLDAVFHSVVATRHDLVVGGGYRFIAESADGGIGYTFTPNRTSEQLVNAFVQDEIALAGRRIALTLGAKFERATDEAVTVQPTARVMWMLPDRQHLWAAISRALRTPSQVDEGVRVDLPPMVPAATPGTPSFPILVSAFGNPMLTNERLISMETGYRIDVGARVALDVSAFDNRYRNLITSEPSAPSLTFVGGVPMIAVSTQFQNLGAADTRGLEFAGHMTVTDAWHLVGAFSTFHLTPHSDALSHDAMAATSDGNAPSFQWRIHSALSLGPRTQTDFLLFHVGALGQLQIPSYTRADARVEWKLTSRVALAIQGQNLLSDSHLEFGGANTSIVTTRVPRSAGVRVMWSY
jgi:iron complex outermembrane receptor protein